MVTIQCKINNKTLCNLTIIYKKYFNVANLLPKMAVIDKILFPRTKAGKIYSDRHWKNLGRTCTKVFCCLLYKQQKRCNCIVPKIAVQHQHMESDTATVWISRAHNSLVSFKKTLRDLDGVNVSIFKIKLNFLLSKFQE